MLAGVAQHRGQQFRAAVGDQVLLGEVRRAVDQAHHLDDAHLGEVTGGGLQRAEQVDRDRSRGQLAGGGVDVLAKLADPGLAVLLGDVAGDEQQIAGAGEGQVGGGRRGQRRQADAELGELGLDGGRAHAGKRGGARKKPRHATPRPQFKGREEGHWQGSRGERGNWWPPVWPGWRAWRCCTAASGCRPRRNSRPSRWRCCCSACCHVGTGWR
mmetsp:Transcript_41226/g.96461  ORF Transcript_41226/g.96461 Transcript_41226/m.96461 type:complete len:213 (+) Transcript_41226:889-1527(+)